MFKSIRKFFKKKPSRVPYHPPYPQVELDNIREYKFDHSVRKDSEDMTEKEKMDKGFNGKTYTINGIEYDF